MKQFWIQVITLTLVIFIALMVSHNPASVDRIVALLGGSATSQPKEQNFLKIVDTAGNLKTKINIEVAVSDEDKRKGLGGRQSLATDSGMLFVFSKPDRYKFWMKGLSFPLDFIWISGDKIVDIFLDAKVPEAGLADNALTIYTSNQPVDKVLEVNAGFVERNKIQIGDLIQL